MEPNCAAPRMMPLLVMAIARKCVVVAGSSCVAISSSNGAVGDSATDMKTQEKEYQIGEEKEGIRLQRSRQIAAVKQLFGPNR